MSRGPGKVERRLRELLSDPSRNEWTQAGLIQTAFGLRAWDRFTDAQRVSGGRALRKILAASDEWRITEPRPFDDVGKRLIRERPAQPSDEKIAIGAYRYKLAEGVEWETATIVRRTRTRCTIEFAGQKIITDVELRPLGESDRFTGMFESEWRFARIRSREVEDQVNAFYQQWDNMAARVHSAFDGEESDAGPSDDPTEWARSLLGLGTTFTDEQLRRAFGVAMQRHHPDHSGDNAIARTLTMARDALRARARSR